ncbi:MAG: hypothetical protein J2P17_03000 [Mycobacterium sp.]|nr:hypothetical protein [Mycobacterium sp.]
MADGGYQGNPDVITSYHKPAAGSALPDWNMISTPCANASALASSTRGRT